VHISFYSYLTAIANLNIFLCEKYSSKNVKDCKLFPFFRLKYSKRNKYLYHSEGDNPKQYPVHGLFRGVYTEQCECARTDNVLFAFIIV